MSIDINDFEKKEWFIVGLSILVVILFGCLVFRPASSGGQDVNKGWKDVDNFIISCNANILS